MGDDDPDQPDKCVVFAAVGCLGNGLLISWLALSLFLSLSLSLALALALNLACRRRPKIPAKLHKGKNSASPLRKNQIAAAKAVPRQASTPSRLSVGLRSCSDSCFAICSCAQDWDAFGVLVKQQFGSATATVSLCTDSATCAGLRLLKCTTDGSRCLLTGHAAKRELCRRRLGLIWTTLSGAIAVPAMSCVRCMHAHAT
jgi:hypothetical protein